MNPERWQQIDQLLQSALEREPGQRSAFLTQACAGDEPLRWEVESLIASHEKVGTILEKPLSQVAAQLLIKGETRLAEGKRIGRYQVKTLLGEGGMGEVYLVQDTVLGRQVALKLLPAQFTRDADRLRRFVLPWSFAFGFVLSVKESFGQLMQQRGPGIEQRPQE